MLINVFFFFLFSLSIILINNFYQKALVKNHVSQIRDLRKKQPHLNNFNLKNIDKNELFEELDYLFDDLKTHIDKLDSSVHDIAHELKTPLTIIRGELELSLLSVKSHEDYVMVLASALDEIIRLTNVINNMQEITKAESGQINMNINELHNLSLLLENTLEDFALLASEKDIEISSDIEKDHFTLFDKQRIHQVILNILDNAVKYTEKGGEINISLRKNEKSDFIIIEIADTGIGISQDQIEKVFERFYRTDKAKEIKASGSGLGLSIAKWIVESHNGKIELWSEEGKGSKFTVYIPSIK